MGQNETILVLAIAFALLINFFFCRNLISTLDQVKPENQELKPVIIWLLLIPIVSLIAMFYVVFRMGSSLENELRDRNFDVTEKPGYIQGLGFACIGIIVNIPMPAPFVAILAVIGLIWFIQYWMKMSWYRKVLQEDVDQL